MLPNEDNLFELTMALNNSYQMDMDEWREFGDKFI